jgi:hypothetical protein
MNGAKGKSEGSRKVPEALVKTVIEAAQEMCAASDYALLLMGLMRHYVYQKLKTRDGEGNGASHGEFIAVPVPWKNGEFQLLPVNVEKYRKVFHLPPESGSDWQAEGEALERFFQRSGAFYENKGSLMLIKIVGLAEEFPDRLEALAVKCDLPFVSVAKIFQTMTFCPHEPAGHPPCIINIPATIRDEGRHTLVRRVNQAILDLLYEALGVLVTIAQIEILRFYEIFKGAPCEIGILKIFFKEDLCFPNPKFDAWLARNLTAKQIVRLIGWKFFSYRFALAFIDAFKKYVRFVARRSARKKHSIMDYPVTLAEQSIKDKAIFSHYDDNEMDDTDTTSMFVSSGDSVYGDIQTYFIEIVRRFVDKMDDGLIFSYSLKGSPFNLIAYIRNIIDNIARTILLEEYDRKLKSSLGLSRKTLKRYDKIYSLQHGKKYLSENDPAEAAYLSETEIRKVRDQLALKQKHRKEGFLTQRQLLEYCQDDEIIEKLQSAGIPLKKQSARIIRKKLEQLRQASKIPYEKTPQAIFYKESDLGLILRELAELQ